MAIAGLVGGTVDGTDDPALVLVQKLARLPIELGGHMGTAVHVGHHPAIKAQGKGARGLAPELHVEHAGGSALWQVMAS